MYIYKSTGGFVEENKKSISKINIISSLINQFVALACGIVIPRLMIKSFGSEIYGATASITQFLAYITLLEGGIGGVARSVLYKPLANQDMETVSSIVEEIKRFFHIIAVIFVIYVLIIACGFKELSRLSCMNWISSFVLVIVISISTFGQYFIGISYSILLQADRKIYITNYLSAFTTFFNAIFVILLLRHNCNIIVVKLASSIIYFMRPVILLLYSRKKYTLIKRNNINNHKYLKNKWTGLGQHLAFFLHSNTDIVMLTILSNLQSVAIYSIYNMIISHLQSLTISFSSGMEAIYGRFIAKKEHKELYISFKSYECILSFVSVVLFSTTLVLIIPFINIYTKGINDTNYIQPLFAQLMIFSAFSYCLRLPYHSIIIAAGHFKQTSIAAYGEALINIILSFALVFKYNLVGVALATLIATWFRFIFYVFYLSQNILFVEIEHFCKRILVNGICLCINFMLGKYITSHFFINNYFVWSCNGLLVFVIFCCTTLLINLIWFKSDICLVYNKLVKK